MLFVGAGKLRATGRAELADMLAQTIFNGDRVGNQRVAEPVRVMFAVSALFHCALGERRREPN